MFNHPPRLLDLFCRRGGASVGYARAGFEVIGVDVEPKGAYPFTHIQADALEVLADVGFMRSFDALAGSPPCQAANPLTTGTNQGKFDYPQLIPQTRSGFAAAGRPYVIENTAGAPIRRDLKLCGDMFDLGVIRHRWFELGGWSVPQPPGCRPGHKGRVRGWRHGVYFDGPYVAVYGKGGGKASVREAQDALGIDWMDDLMDLSESIPPAYSEWIGRALLAHIRATS